MEESQARAHMRQLHGAFVAAARDLLALADPAAAGAPDEPDEVATALLTTTLHAHLFMMRACSTAMGPLWWRMASCRMDTGEPEVRCMRAHARAHARPVTAQRP
jgi:hypothetical protein